MNIVVPVDGSPAALRAVKHAIAMAKAKRGSRLTLVNVQNLVTVGMGEAAIVLPAEVEDRMIRRLGKAATRAAAAACAKARVKFKALIEQGPIAPTVVGVARRERADHIVMGTRGMGGVRGLILGSVATQVVHLASVPVTLVK
jgi:nucleotide-binding universal stress UspA family protein